MSNTSTGSVDPTPKPLLTISAHEDAVYGIAYLSGGRGLVTCSRDKTVRVWDVENGEQKGMTMEHDGWVQGLAVTRDGKRILSGCWDKALRVWDVDTHQPIAEWGDHEGIIRCIVMSPDEQLVASGDYGGRLVIREMNLTEDGRVKHVIETDSGDVHSICFSPDGTKLASAHSDYMVRVFDIENGDLILGPIEGHTLYVNSVVWSLDGSRLFTASTDKSIRFWDSETGAAIGDPLTGHTGFVMSMSLSPDGTKIASASTDKTIRFWAADSGDPIGGPLQHEDGLEAVTFSPSGEFVACGEYYGKVLIWRVPWWDDSMDKAHNLLLDLPAVTIPRHVASDLDRHLDYLGLPTNPRPSPSHTRRRTSHPSEDPRTQCSPFYQKVWRTLPHFLFWRSHTQPRHAAVTTVHPGFATQRVYVASRDNDSTTESPTEPMPTAPGHYPRFSIIAESMSSTDSLDVNRPIPVPPKNSEDVQVSCCALFSRQRVRSGTTSVLPAMELSERTAPLPNPPAPRGLTPSHLTAQNVLDLPAVVEPLSHTR
ncbi:WD40 repeat-like protein [Paxillus ammoniavirescens]|nr:WD40 repeat-like protein [Paxillus ammoniavirescens]